MSSVRRRLWCETGKGHLCWLISAICSLSKPRGVAHQRHMEGCATELSVSRESDCSGG